MTDKSILLSGLAILALCAMGAQAAVPAAAVHGAAPVLSARPVDTIEGKLLMPGHGTHPVQFKPGTVRLRMAAGDIDLDLAELQSVRYGSASGTAAAPATDASPDTCTIVTVRNDILVGACPYRDFQRLLKASGPAAPDSKEHPSAITFPGNLPVPADASAPLWTLKLSDGSLVHAGPSAKSLRLEDANGAFSLPAALVRGIEPDAGTTNLLCIRLADAPYAVRSYIPRGDFEAAIGPDRTFSVPWNAILSIATSGASANKTDAPKTTQRATATYRDPATRAATTLPLPGGFPVTVLSLDTPAGTLLVPSTRIGRIARNPDRTWTVSTVAGDILTGKLALPKLDAAAPAPAAATAAPAVPAAKVSPDTLEAIDFEDRAELAIPEDALVWRLAAGDVLVAARGNPEAASPAAAPATAPAAPAVGRIAAVHASARAAAALPQPAADGAWPEKTYTVVPLATGTPFEIPSKLLDTVRFPPIAALPPATVPAGPSARLTDEVVFPGGIFTLGREHGDGPADETPAVSIQIAPFALANTPVTVAQFRAFVADTGYATTAELMSDPLTWKNPGFAQTDDDPVVCVSWVDAVHYCNWRSKQARLAPAYTIRDGGYRVTLDLEADGYRLPLEAEWEYAARNGGQDILFPWGTTGVEDESAAMAQANFTSIESPLDPWSNTCPVKALPAAPSGLYGMAGNVWEWCQDMYDAKAYVSAYRVGDILPLVNPDPRDCPNGAIARVIRGGSFKNPLFLLRCTARARGFDQQVGRAHVGMRLARNAD